MQDKHKLYLITLLLIVVVVLVVSSIFKAPKKVSSMLENKKNVQVGYSDTNPEQMVTDENKLVDEERNDVANDQNLQEEGVTASNA
ncbi:MAG: hypothetical protein LBI80_02210 [Endomicrobium sp.]|jgi:Sec-independent protein translocase protein TatA|nr:hypothetical protein [Endomicrobium sp.]